MKRKRIERNQNEETSNNGENERFNELDISSEQIDISINESIKDEFVLTREIVENEVLSDITGKKWRIGGPIGKGSFGEIFLTSDDISKPVNVKNSNYVIKIEPHTNGEGLQTANVAIFKYWFIIRSAFRGNSLPIECEQEEWKWWENYQNKEESFFKTNLQKLSKS